MLGVNFINPNYDPLYGGKIHYVETLIECLTTPRAAEQLNIYYTGFKYGNVSLKLKKISQEVDNDILWPIEDFLSLYVTFKKKTLSDHVCVAKNYDGKEATLHVFEHHNGYKLTIANEMEYEMTFSYERFSYLVERIYLGYLQYLYAKFTNTHVLSQKEHTIITEFRLPILKYKEYANNIIFKYIEGDKSFFMKDDFKAMVNGFKIGKLHLKLGDLNCYLPLPLACVMVHDILSEKFFKLFGTKNTVIFSYAGGTPAEKANREDKAPEARVFSILQGTSKEELVFEFKVGKGKTSKNNGIELMTSEHTSVITFTKKELMCFANRYETFLMSFLIEQYLKDQYVEPEKQVISQLIKVSAKNTFVTTVARAFNMKKIRFDFVKYNEQTLNQELYADFYFSEEEFNMLYQAAFSGTLSKKMKIEKDRMKAQNDKWGKPIFTRTCGTPAASSGRKDGCPKSKVFNVAPSSSSDFAFSCYQGKGKVESDGTITMLKIEDRIIVPLNINSLKSLLLITMFAWRAYKIAQTVVLEKMQIEKLNTESSVVNN